MKFRTTARYFFTNSLVKKIWKAKPTAALCYLLQTASQKYVDETKSAIILSMESVFGTLFSILILHEQVTLRMVCGCIIILAAVIVSNLADTQEVQEQPE